MPANMLQQLPLPVTVVGADHYAHLHAALAAERGLCAPGGWEWEHDLGWSRAYPALNVRVYVQLVTPENVADGWRWEADPIGGDVQEPLFESDAEADGGCALDLILDAEAEMARRYPATA